MPREVQRGAQRGQERTREARWGPEKKQDKMCSKKAQKAQKDPERLRTKKSGPERLGEA